MGRLDRAGDLKGMLVEFALSPRFGRELSAAVEENFPSGIVLDEAELALVLDPFVLQHRMASGTTVVEAFVEAHPELAEAEREMLLSWRDVVEGIFDVTGNDRDALILVNLLDEFTYRVRSNLGRKALKPFKKGMFFVGRLVPVGEEWMVSGNPAMFPASSREEMLAFAAEQALRHPEWVFRNPDKLAESRRVAAQHHQVFVEQFGTDLVVVRGDEAPDTFQEFQRRVAAPASHTGQDGEQLADLPVDFPEDLLFAESVVLFSSAEEGLSLYPDYRLLEELFSNPKLIARRRYRETLADYLEDPDAPPELLERLAVRDPDRASVVFTRHLKRKRGFRWDTDSEELLRQHKPQYFDGTVLPRTVVLPEPLSRALRG